MDILESLNPQQLQAVQTTDGPLLVVAGAGSGKTRVITCRIAYLIKYIGIRPEQILAVTFTNKAAEEMKSRVEAMLGPVPRAASPLLSTFHSLCVRMLRRDADRLEGGYTRNFTIYDEDDQSRLIRGIIRDLGIDDKTVSVRQALSAISWAKNRRISPAAYANQTSEAGDRKDKIARIYKVFDERLQQANAFDFDDLLIKAVHLLKRVPEVRKYYHERFRHVMIDEFQDTNGIQYELARLIVTGTDGARGSGRDEETWKNRSLCVVGDVDQSIYGFRGSDFNIILGFQHDFAGTGVIKLEQNYRSTQTILEAANNVILNNQHRLSKNLHASDKLGQGSRIRHYQSFEGEGEAAFVAEKIEEHIRSGTRCAVLYRTNAQSRLFEEALRRRGITYNMVGGFSFYARAEIKDMVAYIKVALNPKDDVAIARIVNSPPRGIGKATLEVVYRKQRELDMSFWEALGAVLEDDLLQPRANGAVRTFMGLISSLSELIVVPEEERPVASLVRRVAFDSGYIEALRKERTEEAESRILNIEELVNAAAEADRKGESLREFIDHAALASDTDHYRPDARVTIMTVHSAKGLEFPAVFIVGMEEGLFPHFRAVGGLDELEEERRLCYVAITRAQQHLYTTHATRRRTFGDELPAEPSRFLKEIPKDLMEDLSMGTSSMSSGFPASEQRARGPKNSTNYRGRTYNSAAGVGEFLKSRVASAASDPVDGDSGSFHVGLRVHHERYGYGVVLGCEGAGDEAKLTVNFPGFGRKKFVAKFASLERV